jgi:hypothetical protein
MILNPKSPGFPGLDNRAFFLAILCIVDILELFYLIENVNIVFGMINYYESQK